MNKSILKQQLEILDKTRKELLVKLGPFTKDFVLGGGTALAIQVNHRKSFDFDFFATSQLEKRLIEKLSRNILVGNIAVDTADELTFFTKDEVKVTFLYYPFDHAYEFKTLENGLKLFSIGDIAIQKAYTVGRRGEYRDYFDLFIILKNAYMNLAEIISQAKKLYGSLFEEKIFLQQLVYFDDLLNFEIVRADKPLPKPAEVKAFFEDLVEKYIAG